MDRNEMITSQIGLAHKLAARLCPGQGKDDLAQEMLLAWTIHHKNFDPSKGYKLSTFATRIMLNALSALSRTNNRLKRKIEAVSIEVEDDDGEIVQRYLCDDENTPANSAEYQSVLKYTHRCMKKLGKMQRGYLQLLMLSPDDTLKEVADKNSIDYKSFCFSVRAGRANLKTIMGEV